MSTQDLLNEIETEEKQRIRNKVNLIKMFYPTIYNQKLANKHLSLAVNK